MAADVVRRACWRARPSPWRSSEYALDAALDFPIAGIGASSSSGNGIDVGRIRGKREIDAGNFCVGAEAFEDFHGDFGAAGFEDRIQRFKPLRDFVFVHVVRHYVCVVFHNSRRVPFVFLMAR